MRQHDAARPEAGAVRVDLLEREMRDRRAGEAMALGDEEIGALSRLDERFGPACVARIDQGAPARSQAQRWGRRGGRRPDFGGPDVDVPEALVGAAWQIDEV